MCIISLGLLGIRQDGFVGAYFSLLLHQCITKDGKIIACFVWYSEFSVILGGRRVLRNMWPWGCVVVLPLDCIVTGRRVVGKLEQGWIPCNTGKLIEYEYI